MRQRGPQRHLPLRPQQGGLARLHGGALEVWTREGDGTNFVLTLPRRSDVAELGRPVPLRPADALPEQAVPQGRRKRRHPVEVGS